MTHVWKIGDWCETSEGKRGIVVNVDGKNMPAVYYAFCNGAHWTYQPKPLPLCDSWDWQPPSPPDPGEGYRPIDPAVDVPQEGDEWWTYGGWHPRGNFGDPFGPHHYRRKLPTYAPFTAESFKPHRDRWIRRVANPGALQVTAYDDNGYWIGSEKFTWQFMLDIGHVFDDDNTPCGVPA